MLFWYSPAAPTFLNVYVVLLFYKIFFSLRIKDLWLMFSDKERWESTLVSISCKGGETFLELLEVPFTFCELDRLYLASKALILLVCVKLAVDCIAGSLFTISGKSLWRSYSASLVMYGSTSSPVSNVYFSSLYF